MRFLREDNQSLLLPGLCPALERRFEQGIMKRELSPLQVRNCSTSQSRFPNGSALRKETYMQKAFSRFFLVLFALALTCVGVSAQQESGQLQGKVTDPQNALVANATVT